jgi:hypothetical protein
MISTYIKPSFIIHKLVFTIIMRTTVYSKKLSNIYLYSYFNIDLLILNTLFEKHRFALPHLKCVQTSKAYQVETYENLI